jgi:hypothetical protein
VTVDAIRGRIRRGTLDSERESGTVYVWVDRAEADSPEPSAASRRPSADQSELVEELRARVEDLREQLQSERQGHAEARRIIAGLVERIPPQIEAPSERSEPRESPESPGPSETPTEGSGGPQRAPERRWWEFWR